MPSEDLRRMQETQARIGNPEEQRDASPIWNYWRRRGEPLEHEHNREEAMISERLERFRNVA